MILSYDVGSMPFSGDFGKFMQGSASMASITAQENLPDHPTGSPEEYFVEKIAGGFVDKVKAGISIPNYPQFRDMNEMFLEMVEGFNKTKNGYLIGERLSLKPGKARLPEVEALRRSSKQIFELMGSKLRVKICVTGPYTLSNNLLQLESRVFRRLSGLITVIVSENIFKEKYMEVSLLSLDEPLFGVLDDPQLDYGSAGRERLREAWEDILHEAKSRGVETSMHLHSTGNELFWDAESLNVVETHVGDPFYSSKQARKNLEKTDKFVKASICITDFDSLIKKKIESSQPEGLGVNIAEQKIADTWTDIRRNRVDPAHFLEDTVVMEKRLNSIVDWFGFHRVKYTGPECGLRSFPTYACAVECLKRVSTATNNVNKVLT